MNGEVVNKPGEQRSKEGGKRVGLLDINSPHKHQQYGHPQQQNVNPNKVIPDEKSMCTLHLVESLALVLLCSCKPTIRKLAIITLKEVRNLFGVLNLSKVVRFDEM